MIPPGIVKESTYSVSRPRLDICSFCAASPLMASPAVCDD